MKRVLVTRKERKCPQRVVGKAGFVEVKVQGLRVSQQEAIGELRSLTLRVGLAQGTASQNDEKSLRHETHCLHLCQSFSSSFVITLFDLNDETN